MNKQTLAEVMYKFGVGLVLFVAFFAVVLFLCSVVLGVLFNTAIGDSALVTPILVIGIIAPLVLSYVLTARIVKNISFVPQNNDNISYFLGWFCSYLIPVSLIAFAYFWRRNSRRRAFQTIAAPFSNIFLLSVLIGLGNVLIAIADSTLLNQEAFFIYSLIIIALLFSPIIVLWFLIDLDWPKKSTIGGSSKQTEEKQRL